MRVEIFLVALGVLSGCSTVYPLSSDRLRQEVTVDTSSTYTGQVKSLAWAAYSVTFECRQDCPYTAEERKTLAAEIADTSFVAFDREIRRALSGERSLALPTTIEGDVRTSSFKTTVSRWLGRLGLKRSEDVVAAAHSLKAINPSELGWTGGESLAALGRKLGVDGVLVGHLLVTTSDDRDEPRRLVIRGPKLWLFSSKSGTAVAVAGVRPSWRLDPPAAVKPAKLDATRELHASRLDWNGIDTVATSFSERVARALQE